jgi:hypothetical protein
MDGRELKSFLVRNGVTARKVSLETGIRYERLSQIFNNYVAATPTEILTIKAAVGKLSAVDLPPENSTTPKVRKEIKYSLSGV